MPIAPTAAAAIARNHGLTQPDAITLATVADDVEHAERLATAHAATPGPALNGDDLEQTLRRKLGLPAADLTSTEVSP